MDKSLLVIGFFCLTLSAINAQTGSELPAIGVLAALGISAGAANTYLFALFQRLRLDLQECEEKITCLEDCRDDLIKVEREEEKCRKEWSECEEAYFKVQSELENTRADLKECEFLRNLCRVHNDECSCAEYTNRVDCEEDLGCDWQSDFCTTAGFVLPA
ncbi:uncharacterized protein LOC133188961 [Saccostrea echinata]|uniref:uncharacterized protein LOC133188961 n=1 Tax=Saccostrea echinata TaxID=191078 RepID=UPI002A7FA214|nr:uncharacterized protein LOC133188961 [Saccostrea echinata]